MIVLGLVLVLLGTVVVLAAIFGGSAAPATLELGFLSIDTSVLGVFLLGAATLLVLVAGLELIRTGARRGYARRQELKEARRVVKEQKRRGRHADHPPPQEAPERGDAAEPPRTS
jgi:hypothetical protein